MYGIKWITGFVIISICVIRFGMTKDRLPEYNLVFNNSLPDAIQCMVRSDHNRYHIEAIKCGKSVHYAVAGSKDPTALITGLIPCKLYECTVESVNQYSLEKFVHIENITTGFRSSPIKVIKFVPEPTSIRFELDFEQIDCIDSFYIVLDNSRAIFWTKYNLTKTLIVSELSPCVKHHFYILFNHQSGPHTILNKVIRTSSIKMGPIENIEFNPETNLLRWKSVFFDDCTSKYVITIIPDSNDETILFESELNECNLDLLGGCSKFLVQIKPKGHDILFGSIRIETGYKWPKSSVRNVQVNMLSKSALSIKWGRPVENPACVIDYAIQINGVWISTTGLEHIVPVCDNSQSFNIFVCVAGLRTTENCVNYNFDVNLKKLVAPIVKQATNSMHFPPLYRLNGWGTITMYDFTDKDAILKINDKISSLPNINFSLAISELTCGRNLVPSYTIFEDKNVNDNCGYLRPDDCTKLCEFSEIPDEIQLTVSEEALFNCVLADHKYIALKRGVTYEIMARISTQTGYTDTTPIVFPKDRVLANKSYFMLYISIPIAGIVAILILITIGLYCHSRDNNVNRTFIEREFQSIDNMDFSHLTTTVPEKEMVGKNRHADIIPYDYNRVVLSTGYINASYIDGCKRGKQYIATQGPAKETVSDFWHMVVEQQCDGIVMLTDLTENGVAQCYQYYPNMNKPLKIKNITVKNIEETNYGCFTKRILQIRQDKVNRYLVHYQYFAWANDDCPADPFDLVEFVENTGSQNCESSYPILIHSSLGVGRTGTFIALDLLFQHLRKEKYISVCETVKKLRSQRCRMVQTIGQYGFLYDCVNMYYLTRIQKRKSGSV